MATNQTLSLIEKKFLTDFSNIIEVTESIKMSTENEELLYLESLRLNDVSKLSPDQLATYNNIRDNGAFKSCIDISSKFPTDDEFYGLYENAKKFLTKTLYPYQVDAMRTMYYLEKTKTHSANGKTVISNGWQLGLPIGSGKSIVFLTYSLFIDAIGCQTLRETPHDIIVSLSGKDIPENIMDHRFISNINYYEKVGYYKDNEPVIMEISDYTYRDLTIVLTHEHLLYQMRNYINEDFTKSLLSKHKIIITTKVDAIQSSHTLAILMYSSDNMKKLRDLGYQKPFKRLILDDYVLMSNIEDCLQVPAVMTWFISGNGYLRSKDILSYGYYSLMFSPFKDITLMGDPKSTLQGIIRNNIFCANIKCYNTGFSIFKFIEENKSIFSKTEYKPIKIFSTSYDFLIYKFICTNIEALCYQIKRIEIAKGKSNLSSSIDTLYYDQWKDLNAFIYKHKFLVDDSLLMNESGVSLSDSPVVSHDCYHCRAPIEKTKGWGLVATCCGAFYCDLCVRDGRCTKGGSVCEKIEVMLFERGGTIFLNFRNRIYPLTDKIDNLSTNNKNYIFKVSTDIGIESQYYNAVYLIDQTTSTNVRIKYYNDRLFTAKDEEIFVANQQKVDVGEFVRCSACNKAHPRFILNCMQKKDTSIKSMELIKQVVNVEEIKSIRNKTDLSINNNAFEIIFFMLLNGFTLKVKSKENTELTQCYESKDNIGLKVLTTIVQIIHETKYNIKDESQIIIYGTEPHMQNKVNEALLHLQHQYPKLFENNVRKIKVMVTDSLKKLIGLQTTILALICWTKPRSAHDQSQLIGRLLRIGPTNPYYFYINLVDK